MTYLGNTFPPYTVDLWGADPEGPEDRHITSLDFQTKQEAVYCFEKPEDFFPAADLALAVFVAFDWDEVFCSKRLISEKEEAKRRQKEFDAHRKEIAMEAGMLGGCEVYNEVMGYDCCPSYGDDD
jgi:hypothetical protein